MRKILGEKFFARDTKLVAKELIGKFLVRKLNGREVAAMITETEAYHGHTDLASHASKGRTARTEVMFGPAGYFYVYLCYGIYYMLNITTFEKDFPAAVLIRGVEGANGPGKLTQALKIDKSLNARKVEKKSNLWIEDRGVVIPHAKIKKTPRIGVLYAGPMWSAKKWRFVLI